jgi:hypothetical protein
MAEDWRRKLPRPVQTREGEIYRTLAEARAMVLEQRGRNEWQAAAGALMAAAEKGTAASLAEAERLLKNALFLDGPRLKL